MNLDLIRDAILRGDWVMSRHARIRAGQRYIDDIGVICALLEGEIIENYPDDPRGQSCLVLGKYRDRFLHAVCALDCNGTLIIITVYEPESPKWINERMRGEK